MEMTTCENSNDNSEKCLDSCCENDVTRFTGTVEWSGEWTGLFPEIKAKIDGIKLAELIDAARDYVKTKIGQGDQPSLICQSNQPSHITSQIKENVQFSVNDPIVGNTWKYIHNLLQSLSGKEYVAQMPVEMLEMIFDTEDNKSSQQDTRDTQDTGDTGDTGGKSSLDIKP